MSDLTLKSDATKGQVKTVVDVEAKTVSCVHHSHNKAAGASFLLNWLLDFSHVSIADVYRMAGENVKIVIRRGFTDDTQPKAATWDNVTFDVAEYLVRQSDPTKAAKAVLARYSKAEILAMLEGIESDE